LCSAGESSTGAIGWRRGLRHHRKTNWPDKRKAGSWGFHRPARSRPSGCRNGRGVQGQRDVGHPRRERRSAPGRRSAGPRACAGAVITHAVNGRGSCLVTTRGSTQQRAGVSTTTDRLAGLDNHSERPRRRSGPCRLRGEQDVVVVVMLGTVGLMMRATRIALGRSRRADCFDPVDGARLVIAMATRDCSGDRTGGCRGRSRGS
jgi:hypothetical protein